MSGPPELALDEVRDFLRAHLGRAVTDVEVVGAGMWSRAYGFVDGGVACVARFGLLRDDFEKDERANALSRPGLPIPKLIVIGEAFDGYFAISERAYGEPLEQLDADAWRTVVPDLVAMFGALRSIDTSGSSGYGLWGSEGNGTHASWSDYLLAVDDDGPARVSGWRARLAESPVGDDEYVAGLAQLQQLADGLTVERSVVHGDLLNRNALVADGRLRAVFDWGCVMYGDFLYELALFEFWSPWYPAMPIESITTAAIGRAGADFDTRLRACLLHIGLSHQGYAAYFAMHDDLVRIVERTREYLSNRCWPFQ